jgi:hypothetical protein
MELNIFKTDRQTERSREIEAAKQAMNEAGSLFDQTIVKLTAAQEQMQQAQQKCADEIAFHQDQIDMEKETSKDLQKRKESVGKVIENVKKMFTFEGVE